MANKKQRQKRDLQQALERDGWKEVGKRDQRKIRNQRRNLKRVS